jgi:hypothetical protein
MYALWNVIARERQRPTKQQTVAIRDFGGLAEGDGCLLTEGDGGALTEDGFAIADVSRSDFVMIFMSGTLRQSASGLAFTVLGCFEWNVLLDFVADRGSCGLRDPLLLEMLIRPKHD